VADAVLTATGNKFSAVAGQVFVGSIGTITDSNPSAMPSDYTVVVNWGDGTTSSTTDETIKVGFAPAPPTGQAFIVTGTHTYAQPGNANLVLTVTRPLNGQVAIATPPPTATVAAPTPSITGTGTTITPLVGVEFSGAVASFSAIPPGGINDFVATIDWGDMSAPSSGTIQLVSPGQYNVLGSHTYATPSGGAPSSSYPVNVTVVQAFGGGTTPTTIKSQAVVQTQPFTGRLDPLSDTGESNSDGITNINQPTFSGTAQPYSLIQIYSKLPQ